MSSRIRLALAAVSLASMDTGCVATGGVPGLLLPRARLRSAA
jgi:hypothetical protein